LRVSSSFLKEKGVEVYLPSLWQQIFAFSSTSSNCCCSQASKKANCPLLNKCVCLVTQFFYVAFFARLAMGATAARCSCLDILLHLYNMFAQKKNFSFKSQIMNLAAAASFHVEKPGNLP
jgi:hypothetical protein